ncbi:phosphorylcholine phosphatase [Geosmithia morbida]|uniref:Phosphorylcholine phosphatase n=1 Tax=Geosmithia morbida TaxID=1094350 RepID=A0A9P4Z039_9HYPO|nr:phosphorylcholine phosphatase [Geosmithia morbida]KAF4126075.1 phosphorylcholine phosphatase [Geosmithia morbida]
MRFSIANALFLAAGLSAAAPTAQDKLKGPELKHWPREAAKALDKMIAANANNGSYAVFDMDNTSYQNDLEEALLPYLENKGVLTRDTIDPFLKLIPFEDTATHNESLYSYYDRLCGMADDICYPWIVEAFSGIPLRELKGYVDELMALNTTVPTTYFGSDGSLATMEIKPPSVFEGQVELYNRLMANGIKVYVISAAAEELVRMVASDPRYGYNVPPENVIGVSALLKDRQGHLTTARQQIDQGEYTAAARQRNLDSSIIPFLWAPATWKTGKWSAILAYIDEWKRPVLAAGDTPDSDGPMIFHGVNVDRGGIHLFVQRSNETRSEIDTMIKDFSQAQRDEGLPVTADKNWVIVKPADLHRTH